MVCLKPSMRCSYRESRADRQLLVRHEDVCGKGDDRNTSGCQRPHEAEENGVHPLREYPTKLNRPSVLYPLEGDQRRVSLYQHRRISLAAFLTLIHCCSQAKNLMNRIPPMSSLRIAILLSWAMDCPRRICEDETQASELSSRSER